MCMYITAMKKTTQYDGTTGLKIAEKMRYKLILDIFAMRKLTILFFFSVTRSCVDSDQ